MKALTKKRMLQILKQKKWGTLMTVDGKKPYGIEVAYTITGKFLYIIFNPAGRASRCAQKNKNAAFKVCTTDDDMNKWAAVLIEGTLKRVSSSRDIKKAFRALARRLNYDENLYNKMAEKYVANPQRSPVHRLSLDIMAGRANF